MNKSHIGAWSATAILAGALCVASMPAKAGPITILSDNFSTATLGESQTTVDTNFSTQNGTNVDVLGNVGTVPTMPTFTYNLTAFEDICTATSATVEANCVDLDGTANTDGANPQGVLESGALTLTSGTYTFAYDLLGSNGYLATDVRTLTTSTTILFGNAACIASPSVGNCVYDNTIASLLANDTSTGNVSDSGLTVGAGTYYIEFISNTPGQTGAILSDVDLTETAVATPEPSTMLLLGAGFLGLGGLRRWRTRRAAR